MALVQAILAFIVRSLGRILNMAFGWATVLLFGKVPADRQIYLTMIAFGSVLWLIAALGIAFPSFATFLFAFVTLPEWMDRTHVRLAMLAIAGALPPILGIVSIFMLAPGDRPKGARDKALAVLRGYPYTFGLALTVLLMLVFAPIMRVRRLVRRWKSQHVPVLVEPRDYLSVVADLQGALERGGMKLERRPGPWMLRIPTKILMTLSGNRVHRLVADELTLLASREVEVLLHPSDLVITGREPKASRAHAILSEHLGFSKAYLTWDKEANEIEDRIRTIYEDVVRAGDGPISEEALERLRSVERALVDIEIPYEEWEVLFREKLLVERLILRRAAGLDGGAVDRNAIQALGRQPGLAA